MERAISASILTNAIVQERGRSSARHEDAGIPVYGLILVVRVIAPNLVSPGVCIDLADEPSVEDICPPRLVEFALPVCPFAPYDRAASLEQGCFRSEGAEGNVTDTQSVGTIARARSRRFGYGT
jgi:hypothetical protein